MFYMYLCSAPEPQDSRLGVTVCRGVVSSQTVRARMVSRVARLCRLWRLLSSRLIQHLRTLSLHQHLWTLSLCRLEACR